MKRAVGTFSAKLNQMFIVGILIPFFIAFLVFVAYSIWTVVEREEKSAQNILNSVSQSLELQFAENEKIKDMFYINKEVFQEAERLNNPQLYTYYDDYSNAQIENAYTGVFTKMLYTSQQNVRAITFFPMSGEGDTAYYLGKSKAKIREITYPDYKGTRWFLEAVNEIGKQFYYAPHMPEYLPNKNLGEVYSYVNAIWDNDTRRAIGVVKIDIDAKEIQEKLGVLPVRFAYQPDGMCLANYWIKEDVNNAFISYKIGPSRLHIYINKKHDEASINNRSDSEIIDTLNIESCGLEVDIEEYQDEQLQTYYTVSFEYLNTYYFISGMMEKEEFIKILENIWIKNV